MTSTATLTRYTAASLGTRTAHAIVAGAALPGEFGTTACGKDGAMVNRSALEITAADLASPTFCKRCARTIEAAWHQDELDGYTVATTPPAPMFEVVAELSVDVDGFDAWQAANGMPATRPVAGIGTIADYALAVEHAAHARAGDGRLF